MSQSTQVVPSYAPIKVQVLRNLRRAITSRELKPGQRITQQDLVEMTGASRSTVREVLAELASHGIVRVVPPRGTFIADIGPDEAEVLYEVRAALEHIAVRRFVLHAGQAELEALKRVEPAVAAAAEISELVSAKDDLYDVLFATSPLIADMLSWVRLRTTLCRAESLSAPGRLVASKAEVAEMVEEVFRGNADRAADLAGTHVYAAFEAFKVAQTLECKDGKR